MKKIIFSLALLSATASLSAQKSCCLASATELFAGLTGDKEFIESHIEPRYFILDTPLGKTITFKTPAGKQGYAYEIKSATQTDNYLFIFHEWWGLNDYVKQESEKYFAALGNVNVIAVDLYNQKTAVNRDSAAKYMNAVNSNDAGDVIKGAINYAGKKARISTVGWCFGGGWSLQAALLCEKQAQACVMYYGIPKKIKRN
jgi:carboxymethylenebutenolidase